jgi:exopolyphosphatase/guanosine-5'-triphosphate,3'-diphosphate pyrophosphatase
MTLAAIDIGSNGAKLLINEVSQDDKGNDVFTKINFIRVPLRLGFDVFEEQNISEKKIQMFMHTMKAYKHLIDAYEVQHTKVCATSAMRDAENANEIIKRIKKECDLEIEVISGDYEASLLYENSITKNLGTDYSYLLIDVGGGSTELSFFNKGVLTFKKSFDIGAIRLLKNVITESDWNELREFIIARKKEYKNIIAIGFGGNIIKAFSMSKRKNGKALSVDFLKAFYKELNALPLEERIIKYGLRKDRADVIVPALEIFINILRWFSIEKIFVPKIGLSDGLIRHLWEDVKNDFPEIENNIIKKL